MTDNYWQNLATEGVQAEGGGGGNVIAQGMVEMAFAAYVPGFKGDDQEKCIFRVAPATGKDARAAAFTAANKKAIAFATANGHDFKRVSYSAITYIYLENAKKANGADVEWQGDRIDKVPLWTKDKDDPSAAKDVLAALEKAGVKAGVKFYGRFGWIPDANKVFHKNMSDEDAEGNPKYPMVCVVQEVYADRAAAQAAVSAGAEAAESADSTGYTWAGGWSQDDLADAVNTLTNEKDTYDTFAELEDNEIGEGLGFGVKLLSEVGEMDVADIVKFTGLKPGVVRKALKS